MTWEDQGRQDHGWFGHGTAPVTTDQTDGSADKLFDPANKAGRFAAIAHAAIADLPRAERGRSAASFDSKRLAQFTSLMAVLSGNKRLELAALGCIAADGETIGKLRQAAALASNAQTQQELAQASSFVAQAMQAVGLDRWSATLAKTADATNPGDTIQNPESKASKPGTDTRRESGSPAPNDQKKAQFQAQFQAATADAYQKSALDCSHYLQTFLKDMGFTDTPYRTANDFMAFVHQKDSGWYPVSADEAVSLSASGHIVMAGLAESGHSGHVMVVGQKMMPPTTTTRVSQSPQVFGGGAEVAGWSANRSSGQNTVADAWPQQEWSRVEYWVMK
jgi:hypothetical protein